MSVYVCMYIYIYISKVILSKLSSLCAYAQTHIHRLTYYCLVLTLLLVFYSLSLCDTHTRTLSLSLSRSLSLSFTRAHKGCLVETLQPCAYPHVWRRRLLRGCVRTATRRRLHCCSYLESHQWQEYGCRCGDNAVPCTATAHCNTLRHTASHCITLQHTATRRCGDNAVQGWRGAMCVWAGLHVGQQ